MAKKLLESCENSRRGCKKMMPAASISVHQEHCDFKELVCESVVGPEGCPWTGTRKELTDHVHDKHPSILLRDFKHDFQIPNYSKFEHFSETVLLTSFGHLFVAKLGYSESDRAFYGGVQLVSGVVGLTAEFRYEFEIGKQTKDDVVHYKLMYSRQTHKISEEFKKHGLSDECHYFWFSKDIGSFFTDITDTLTVTVILKSVQSLAMKRCDAERTYGFVPTQYCHHCVSNFNPSPLV